MTRRPKILAQGPGYTQAEYLTTLAAGHETGWWDENGVPAPWPDDFLDPPQRLAHRHPRPRHHTQPRRTTLLTRALEGSAATPLPGT